MSRPAAAGRLKGGAAKFSVLSSSAVRHRSFFFSWGGSASANVAPPGANSTLARNWTKLGYPKRLAAAVEAVAPSLGRADHAAPDGRRLPLSWLKALPAWPFTLALCRRRALPGACCISWRSGGINAYARPRFSPESMPRRSAGPLRGRW